MKKRYKILIGILVLLSLTMVFPPKKNNGNLNLESFISETNPPQHVQNILKNACYDCHSNQTKYPPYSRYPIVNYWLANHVNKGKEHLNFSEWGTYNNNQKKYILKNCISELETRGMPLRTYQIKHPEAILSNNDVDLAIKWIKDVSIKFN